MKKEEQLKQTEEETQLTTELSIADGNYPLWLSFREVAPGSHKHTQSLLNTVDNVASAIDIKSDNLMLAARYHDIGKMWSPALFTENQGKDNLHDGLEPWISYQLLTRHVSDTVLILMNHNFPLEAIRIAAQHHGTTVLRGIFDKAKKDYPDLVFNEEEYRYHTEKPSSLEALILMLCDQVEATSRSIYVDQKLEVEPDVFIDNIFNKLMMDGQFDNVEVKLGLITRIKKALTEDVAGNYQKRVAYEEDDRLVKKE